MSKIKIKYTDSKTGNLVVGITSCYADILDMLDDGLKNDENFMLDSGESVNYKCLISVEDTLEE